MNRLYFRGYRSALRGANFLLTFSETFQAIWRVHDKWASFGLEGCFPHGASSLASKTEFQGGFNFATETIRIWCSPSAK